MKKIISCITVVWITLILFSACENPGYYEGGVEGGEIPRDTVYFEEQNDGRVLFETNEEWALGPVDPNNPGKRIGTTQWSIGTSPFGFEIGDILKVNMQKISGSADGGYGVVFSAKDVDNFYAVFINTQSTTGYYKIGKTTTGIFVPFDEWQPSKQINNSPGVKNTILISYDHDANRYYVFFNGDTKGIWFEDKDQPFPVEGCCGYICEIDGEENFPGTAVKVWYEQVEPADIGIWE
jgi:hypothetical protein